MATTEDVVEGTDIEHFAVRFDAEMRDLLMQLSEGEAHSTRLREVTGLSRQNVNRRLEDLEADGVITTEVKQPAEGGQRRKHARLTEYGEDLIDDGLLDAITDTNTNVLALKKQLDQLSSELQEDLSRKPSSYDVREVADARATEVREALRDDIEQLQSQLEQVQREARDARSEARGVDETLEARVSAVEDQVNDLQSTADRLERQADTVTERLDELESGRRARRIDALVEHVGRLSIQVSELDERLGNAESDAGRALRIAFDTREDVDEQLDEHEERINNKTGSMHDEIIQFDRRISKIEDSLEDATEVDESIAEMENRLSELKKDWIELSEDVKNNKRGGWFFG